MTRPAALDLDPATVWKRLAVTDVSEETVAFEAFYVRGGIPGSQRELSAFRRVEGNWTYVGPQPTT